METMGELEKQAHELLRALPVVEGSELVGMLTVDDIGQARLLKREQLRARAR